LGLGKGRKKRQGGRGRMEGAQVIYLIPQK
jgi:hypothetical protein